MKLILRHIFSDDNGINWNSQEWKFENIKFIETRYYREYHEGEFTPDHWLIIHYNEEGKDPEYCDFYQDEFSWDTIEITD